LRSLALQDEDVRAHAAQEGAIPKLVQLLAIGSHTGKESVAGALRNLALLAENKKLIASAGAIPLLVNILDAKLAGEREQAVGCLRILAYQEPENQAAIATAGGCAKVCTSVPCRILSFLFFLLSSSFLSLFVCFFFSSPLPKERSV
jgi:hypothetical protein